MIGLEPAQRFFQHLHAQAGTAPMRADLRHQKYPVALALQRPTEPVFRPAVIILPAVVEESDTTFDRFMHQVHRLIHRFGVAEMMSAHSQRRYLDALVSPEGTQGDAVAVVLCLGIGLSGRPANGSQTQSAGSLQELTTMGSRCGVV